MLWVCLGCSFGPREDPSRFYILPSSREATAPTSGGTVSAVPDTGDVRGSVAVGLGPVLLPGYLDRSEIVVRRSETEVELRRWDRWAEPLGTALGRVLADELRRHPTVGRVALFPWRGGATVDRAVEIDVVRFECTSLDAAVLEARWRVGSGLGGRPLAEGTFRRRVESSSEGLGGCVEAMGLAAEALAGEIAASLTD